MIQIDWDIIERKLDGELAPEEEARFGEWYAADEKNKSYFQKVEKFYLENGFVKEITEGQASVSWNKFNSRLRGAKQVRGRRLYHWWMSGVAACLLIGIGVFMWEQKSGDLNEDAGRSIAAAKGGGVILTLSTGEEITLEDHLNGIEDVSAKIVNSGSVLSYEKKDTITSETEYNQVKTPRGGEYSVKLSDGTRVCLGALSVLKYPVTFKGEERVVEVSGEAFFDVVRDPEHPFVVEMNGMKVEVLGTSFNVRDYSDEAFIETTLVSGKVKVFSGMDSCVLEPSQQASWSKAMDVLAVKEVDVSEFVDWKDGKLNIRNQRLEDILIRLNKWYNIQVFFADAKAKEVRFYANIDRYADLKELLDKFEKTGQVKFDVKGNTITVMSAR